ncbi:MAG: MarC family protein [Victivallaceae bacterium]|jgi:multiple antibiotic resistance protein
MNSIKLLELSLYFLALLNPASKILFLASKKPAFTGRQIWHISYKSTLIALIMLLIFCVAGQFLLEHIFHIAIYSLKVAGGIVLFIIGFTAMRKGVFYQKDNDEEHQHESIDDISIVPLAAPLIAGPGTITAAISFSAEYGLLSTTLALTMAILVNFVFMLFSLGINKILEYFYITGPVIRITGLIVSAVAVQMIFDGSAEWLKIVLKHTGA